MPTYDYKCTKCQHRFEMLQTMNEPPRKRCPECGCKVERLIGAGSGLIFKGSGFYLTDYKDRPKGDKKEKKKKKKDDKQVKKDKNVVTAKT